MNSRHPEIAHLASASHPQNESGLESALAAQNLEASIDCFSEIDTESFSPENNKIVYLEQLLRLHEPQHLSETQKSGRRFVLDMLRVLCLLPDVQRAQEGGSDLPKNWDPDLEFKYLVYLFERTSSAALAEKVRKASSILSLDAQGILELREWLGKNGLDAHELSLIQPNFFRGQKMTQQDSKQLHLHPMFAELSKESLERNHDYLVRTFYGLSYPFFKDSEGGNVSKSTQDAGLEEAMAPVFDLAADLNTAVKTRLKAFFIPNRQGEPMVALSFTQE